MSLGKINILSSKMPKQEVLLVEAALDFQSKCYISKREKSKMSLHFSQTFFRHFAVVWNIYFWTFEWI